MSTEYLLYKDGKHKIELVEGSSEFDLVITEDDPVRHLADDGICIISVPERSMTADQVVDLAVKMLQPVLYNVKDPPKYFEEIIQKMRRTLFV